jgi:hypothetical protein
MSTNANNNGPAPPYEGTPPSNAEMMAELHLLRNTVRTLQGRINDMPAAQPAPNPMQYRRDLGESIKPPLPEPFRGQSTDVMPFLTRMKGYFRLFPNKLDSAEKKMLATAPLIQGDAKDWFEPIWKDYLENDENLQDQETQNVFSNWLNFEELLKDNFGVINEERQAAADILQLKQHKSCAAHSAKFRQLAAKTGWDDEALMEIYYRSLKEEVKDELHKADRPDTDDGGLTEYITMAIKIDERQYERRREKQNSVRKGSNYNPYYPNQHNNRGNPAKPRYQGKTQRNYGNNTSYGTHPGPMDLGAAQAPERQRRDFSKCKCYNCNQVGHISRHCPQPRKPRNPNHGKQTLGMTNQQEPQMAIRTQTLGMCRNGYDMGMTNSIKKAGDGMYGYPPHPDSSLRIPSQNFESKEEIQEKWENPKRTPKQEKTRRYNLERSSTDEAREAARLRTQRLRAKKKAGETQTLGVMTTPATPSNEASKAIDNIPVRTKTQEKEEIVLQEREAEHLRRTRQQRQTRSMGRRGKAAKATAQYLRSEDERLENKWKQEYRPLYDEMGIRMFNSKEDMYMQGSKERKDTAKNENIHVRAYHMAEALNPHHKEPKFNTRDSAKTMPTHPEHDNIAWVSCRYHWCELHMETKKDNDCFPVAIPGTPNDKPYSPEEVRGYLTHSWYENLGVAELRFNLAYYKSQQKDQETAEAIRESMRVIEEANQEFKELTKGKYNHLMKSDNGDKDNESEDTNELDCIWEEDGLHLASIYSKTQQPDKFAEELAKRRVFKHIDLEEGFEQVEISKNDYENCNDDKCERHAESGKDKRLL